MYCDQALQDNKPVHVCHKGYLSLFPMTLGLLPADSPKLGAILDIIENEDELWSPYGLRSLSASDPIFGTGENYWRGPIWININYLTLQSLYKVCILVKRSFISSLINHAYIRITCMFLAHFKTEQIKSIPS